MRVAAVVVSLLLVSARILSAQTIDTVAKFNSSGTPVDSAIVEASGNVGIGTSSPGAALDVAGSSGIIVQQIRNPAGSVKVRNSANTGTLFDMGDSMLRAWAPVRFEASPLIINDTP